MSDFTIGVLGGMGTYATIHLFQQYAEIFPAEKEWERPRIIIDNRCTMPSRVRAFIYHDKTDQLVNEMADSMKSLVEAGCTRIVLACNTSHLFLPRIYEYVPELEEKVLHIIENCVKEMKKEKIAKAFLLASEGTIDSQIYQKALCAEDIECVAPTKDEYPLLRECIEAVKQHTYSEKIKKNFLRLVNRYDTCILGCTELPVLYEKFHLEVTWGHVIDPLYMALKTLKKEYEND